MINPLSELWRLQQRVRTLRRVTPLFDAIRLAFIDRYQGDLQIFLKPGRQTIVIRPRTSDLKCFEKVFLAEEYRMPFEESPRLIVDAGANIGMATLYFSARYPDARIVAIEPEPSNFEILKLNCGHLKNVMLIQAALWFDRESLAISDASAEKWAFTVTDRTPQSVGSVRTITIGDIVRQIAVAQIDLLKLDIEGSEKELFARKTEQWLDRVRIIAIEFHDRFQPGCAQAVYSALAGRKFVQEIRGENVFIKLCEMPNVK